MILLFRYEIKTTPLLVFYFVNKVAEIILRKKKLITLEINKFFLGTFGKNSALEEA